MSYFKSENVYMYPSGYRQYNDGGVDISVNPESKLNTEFNLTNIVSRLVTQNKGSFIVSYSQNVIEFFIHGYFFQVKNFTPSGDMYATIRLSKTAITGETDYINMWELYPYDASTYNTRNLDYLDNSDINFIALYISNTIPEIQTSDDEYYTLCLSKDGSIPKYSKFKLDLDDIYGGHTNAGVKKSALDVIDNTKVITAKLITPYAKVSSLDSIDIHTSGINDLNIDKDSNKFIRLNNKETGSSEIVAYIKQSGTVEMIDTDQTITCYKQFKSSKVEFYTGNSIKPFLALSARDNTISGEDNTIYFENSSLNYHKNGDFESDVKLDIGANNQYILTFTKSNGATEYERTTIKSSGINTPAVNGVVIGKDTDTDDVKLNLHKVLFSDVAQTITANKRLGSTLYLGTSNTNYYINNSGNAKFNTLIVDDTLTSIGNNQNPQYNSLSISKGKIEITKVGYTSSEGYTGIHGGHISTYHLSADEIKCAGRVTAVNFYATSDQRLKENISPFKYTKSILDLPIKRFDYIDGAKNQIGCLAQDLQQLYPELVYENKDGYLSIQENKLVYLLIEEIKQLKTIVDKQQVELNKLIN